MARRMADPAYHQEQCRRQFDEHIAPINQFVDSLRVSREDWIPYVAPIYGGTQARLLSLLRDPGPKTREKGGSGFLSMENDDATAEAICHYYERAGIPASEVAPWNIYPWYINRAPTAVELKRGIEPLRRLLDLMPKLRVVMIHGVSAQRGWDRFHAQHPECKAVRGFRVIKTFHTSRQAFWHRDPSVRDARRKHLRDSFAEASRFLST